MKTEIVHIEKVVSGDSLIGSDNHVYTVRGVESVPDGWYVLADDSHGDNADDLVSNDAEPYVERIVV